MMLNYQTKFGCKQSSSLEDIVKNSYILIIQALTVTLTLKIENQFFHMTHCLTIIHHHTKSGKKKKWLGGSGDTEWTQLLTDRTTDRQKDKRME